MKKRTLKLWLATALLTLGISGTALADEVPAEYQAVWQQLMNDLKMGGFDEIPYNSQLVADYEAFKNGAEIGDQRYMSFMYDPTMGVQTDLIGWDHNSMTRIHTSTIAGDGSWINGWYGYMSNNGYDSQEHWFELGNCAESAAIIPATALAENDSRSSSPDYEDVLILLVSWEDANGDGTYWRYEEKEKTWTTDRPWYSDFYSKKRQWSNGPKFPIYGVGNGTDDIYYYESNQPVTGWRQMPPLNGWYYFENGLLKLGKFDADGKTYHGSLAGCVTNSWATSQWLDSSSGRIVKGEYYYGEDGAMLRGGVSPDGYYINEDGSRGILVEPKDYSQYAPTEHEQLVVDLVNQYRAANGKPPVVWNNAVAAGAKEGVDREPEGEWARDIEKYSMVTVVFCYTKETPDWYKEALNEDFLSGQRIDLGNSHYISNSKSSVDGPRYSERLLGDWTMIGMVTHGDLGTQHNIRLAR